jgi:hypothetical protein
MFCPTCGAQSIEQLNYCKHCGASLALTAGTGHQNSPAKSIETLGWVIAGTTITLLGMALGSLVLINGGAIDATLGRVVVIMSLVGFVLVDGVLLWRLLREARRQNETASLAASNSSTRELQPAPGRELSEPVPSVSVTEPTTRELEPAPRSRDSILS